MISEEQGGLMVRSSAVWGIWRGGRSCLGSGPGGGVYTPRVIGFSVAGSGQEFAIERNRHSADFSSGGLPGVKCGVD